MSRRQDPSCRRTDPPGELPRSGELSMGTLWERPPVKDMPSELQPGAQSPLGCPAPALRHPPS